MLIEKIKDHLFNFWLSYLLSAAAIYFLLNRGTYTFLDFIDLLIHEPGHLIFGIFGDFMQFLGGTLMQIILPLSIALYSLYKGYKYFSQIFFFWLGHNFINISVYADDANKMKLHLIGGIHDWNWLLGRMNMINYAKEVGYFFVGLSIVSFLVMFFIPYFLKEDYQTIDEL